MLLKRLHLLLPWMLHASIFRDDPKFSRRGREQSPGIPDFPVDDLENPSGGAVGPPPNSPKWMAGSNHRAAPASPSSYFETTLNRERSRSANMMAKQLSPVLRSAPAPRSSCSLLRASSQSSLLGLRGLPGGSSSSCPAALSGLSGLSKLVEEAGSSEEEDSSSAAADHLQHDQDQDNNAPGLADSAGVSVESSLPYPARIFVRSSSAGADAPSLIPSASTSSSRRGSKHSSAGGVLSRLEEEFVRPPDQGMDVESAAPPPTQEDSTTTSSRAALQSPRSFSVGGGLPSFAGVDALSMRRSIYRTVLATTSPILKVQSCPAGLSQIMQEQGQQSDRKVTFLSRDHTDGTTRAKNKHKVAATTFVSNESDGSDVATSSMDSMQLLPPACLDEEERAVELEDGGARSPSPPFSAGGGAADSNYHDDDEESCLSSASRKSSKQSCSGNFGRSVSGLADLKRSLSELSLLAASSDPGESTSAGSTVGFSSRRPSESSLRGSNRPSYGNLLDFASLPGSKRPSCGSLVDFAITGSAYSNMQGGGQEGSQHDFRSEAASPSATETEDDLQVWQHQEQDPPAPHDLLFLDSEEGNFGTGAPIEEHYGTAKLKKKRVLEDEEHSSLESKVVAAGGHGERGSDFWPQDAEDESSVSMAATASDGVSEADETSGRARCDNSQLGDLQVSSGRPAVRSSPLQQTGRASRQFFHLGCGGIFAAFLAGLSSPWQRSAPVPHATFVPPPSGGFATGQKAKTEDHFQEMESTFARALARGRRELDANIVPDQHAMAMPPGSTDLTGSAARDHPPRIFGGSKRSRGRRRGRRLNMIAKNCSIATDAVKVLRATTNLVGSRMLRQVVGSILSFAGGNQINSCFVNFLEALDSGFSVDSVLQPFSPTNAETAFQQSVDLLAGPAPEEGAAAPAEELVFRPELQVDGAPAHRELCELLGSTVSPGTQLGDFAELTRALESEAAATAFFGNVAKPLLKLVHANSALCAKVEHFTEGVVLFLVQNVMPVFQTARGLEGGPQGVGVQQLQSDVESQAKDIVTADLKPSSSNAVDVAQEQFNPVDILQQQDPLDASSSSGSMLDVGSSGAMFDTSSAAGKVGDAATLQLVNQVQEKMAKLSDEALSALLNAGAEGAGTLKTKMPVITNVIEFKAVASVLLLAAVAGLTEVIVMEALKVPFEELEAYENRLLRFLVRCRRRGVTLEEAVEAALGSAAGVDVLADEEDAPDLLEQVPPRKLVKNLASESVVEQRNAAGDTTSTRK